MPVEALPHGPADALGLADLLDRCVANSADSIAWTEFLRRFSASLRAFVRCTARQERIPPVHEHDLYQNVILKLVQGGCAVLRRFTGTSDAEFRAYLAVIARSVVRDFRRHLRAQKRPQEERALPIAGPDVPEPRRPRPDDGLEREVLSRELTDLGMKVIKRDSGAFSSRDQLIFMLYYREGLSTSEIARCGTFDLSQRGVAKVLNRLTDRVRTAADAHSPEAKP